MALAPGTMVGAYEILSLLGTGGMGEVYAAHDPRLDRKIAVKIFSGDIAIASELRDRFEREARAIAALNHPNIVTIHSIESDGDTRFLTMELVDGRTLDTFVPKSGLPLPRFLGFAVPLAEALSAAHARGITHRDLKPQNVMVSGDGRIKVLDFGLAKLRDDAMAAAATDATRVTTGDGRILGTVAYMSPEQAEGRPLDHRTDLFSLGVMFYEILTGARPFTGDSAVSMLASIVRDSPRPVSEIRCDLPAEATRIVHKLLAKDAGRRYQTANDLLIDLEALKEHASSARGPLGTPVAQPRRLRWALALAAAGGLAISWLIGASLTGRTTSGATASTRTPAHVQMPVGDGKVIQNFIPTDESGSGLALSADGTTLAYAATTPGATPRLHVRRVDEDAPRELEGTEGAFAPFFSPDGAWIAYVASNRLFRIPTKGGPPVPVLTLTSTGAANFSSGHWFEPDRLVFTNGVELVLLDSSGTVLTPLARADDRVWAVLSPQVLADRHHVIYERWPTSDREDEAEIVIQPLDGSAPSRLLIKGATRPKLSGEFVLYQKEGGVYAIRLDPGSMTVGSPLRLPIPGRGRWRLASSTSTLAFYSAPSASRQLTWVDRNGREEPLALGLAHPTDVGLSPNGDAVVVSSGRLTHLFWLGDLNRNTATRLTIDFHAHHPLFLPDGSGLVFRGGRTAPLTLHRMDLVGGSPQPLLAGTSAQAPFSWTPDGKTLLYSSRSDGTGDDLLAMAWDTRSVTPVLQTKFDEMAPALSPDGRWLAYQSNETATGRNEIYLQAYPGPSVRKVVSTHGGLLPTWAHDGRRLYWADLGDASGSRLWEADVTSGVPGHPRQLFGGIRGGGNRFYAVGRDGRILVMKETGEQQVTAIDLILNWDIELRRLAESE